MANEPELKSFKDLLKEAILPNIEKIGVGLLLISFIFYLAGLPGFREMSNISITTLAITYFLQSFLMENKEGKIFDSVAVKIGFISCAVVLIGWMFLILSLSGAMEMLTIGLPTLGLAVTYGVYSMLNTESEITFNMFGRMAVVLMIGIIAYFW